MNNIFTRFSLVLILCCLSLISKGQSLNGIPHRFAVTAATPAAFPTVGNLNVIVPAASVDEWDTLIAPVGFSFVFAGVTYTKIILSTNGWMALAPASASYPLTVPPLPINQLNNNTTNLPIIAPLWDDLSTSVVVYNVSGGSLWVRWTSRWQKTNAAAPSSLFYVKLEMATGIITFNYFNNAGYIPATPSASIGIAGTCVGDYYSAFTTGATAAYVDSTTENANIGQGGATTMRPFNCYYTWTPYSPNDNCASAIMGGLSQTLVRILAIQQLTQRQADSVTAQRRM